MGHFVSWLNSGKNAVQLEQRGWRTAEERKRIGNRFGAGIRGIGKKSGDGETNRQLHYRSDVGWRVRHLAYRAVPGFICQPVRMGMQDLGRGHEGDQQQTNHYRPALDR